MTPPITSITIDTTWTGQTFDSAIFEGVEDAHPITVKLDGCTFRRVYLRNCLVDISRCRGRNVGRNWLQLDDCRPAPGAEARAVRDCIVTNEPGKTRVEDIYSLCDCTGVVVRGCWAEGGGAMVLGGGQLDPGYSGSGFMIDYGCQRCAIVDCTAVNTHNVGIAIAGGQNNSLLRNTSVSDGQGCNGNVGFYINNRYPKNPWGGNSGAGNRALWRRARMGRNDWWIQGGSWTGGQHLQGWDRTAALAAWLARTGLDNNGQQRIGTASNG